MSKNTAVRVSILTFFLSASIFSCVLYAKSALFPICGAAVFILLNIFPSLIKRPSKKLRISSDAAEIAKKVKRITEQTGCEKVNVIAHSKGGLDCRYAITHLGLDRYVAPQPQRHRYPRVLCRTCRRSERSRILIHMRILIHT